jgi:hypothetical protein
VDLLPLYDESAPVACTLGAHEVTDRVALIERIRTALTDVQRTELGLLLQLASRAEVEADLRQFAVDEKRCCQFWGFEVTSGPPLTLRWDGPPAANDLLDALHDYLTGRTDLSTIARLL